MLECKLKGSVNTFLIDTIYKLSVAPNAIVDNLGVASRDFFRTKLISFHV
jgi:hypothetical protein